MQIWMKFKFNFATRSLGTLSHLSLLLFVCLSLCLLKLIWCFVSDVCICLWFNLAVGLECAYRASDWFVGQHQLSDG